MECASPDCHEEALPLSRFCGPHCIDAVEPFLPPPHGNPPYLRGPVPVPVEDPPTRELPGMAAVLEELRAMEAIARALEPLSPRMRAAVLQFVSEYLADKRAKAASTPSLEEP